MRANSKTFLLAYYDDKGHRRDITNKDVSKELKVAATTLDYPTAKGIPINESTLILYEVAAPTPYL